MHEPGTGAVQPGRGFTDRPRLDRVKRVSAMN